MDILSDEVQATLDGLGIPLQIEASFIPEDTLGNMIIGQITNHSQRCNDITCKVRCRLQISISAIAGITIVYINALLISCGYEIWHVARLCGKFKLDNGMSCTLSSR